MAKIDVDRTGCEPSENPVAKHPKSRGPYQQVYSGRPFYLLDPRPEEVDFEDIAQSLSKQCRYIGHCTSFYSVAQHSELVAAIACHMNPAFEPYGFIHDFTEAYTGDRSRPNKIALEKYSPGIVRAIEEPLEKAIFQAFGLDHAYYESIHEHIKLADNIALATEKRDLMKNTGDTDWGNLPDPAYWKIFARSPESALVAFKAYYADLQFRKLIK